MELTQQDKERLLVSKFSDTVNKLCATYYLKYGSCVIVRCLHKTGIDVYCQSSHRKISPDTTEDHLFELAGEWKIQYPEYRDPRKVVISLDSSDQQIVVRSKEEYLEFLIERSTGQLAENSEYRQKFIDKLVW
jgi:hypothetical protein